MAPHGNRRRRRRRALGHPQSSASVQPTRSTGSPSTWGGCLSFILGSTRGPSTPLGGPLDTRSGVSRRAETPRSLEIEQVPSPVHLLVFSLLFPRDRAHPTHTQVAVHSDGCTPIVSISTPMLPREACQSTRNLDRIASAAFPPGPLQLL